MNNTDVPWGTKAMVYIPSSAVTELAAIAEKHQDALAAAADLKESGDAAVIAATAILPRSEINAVLRSRIGVINLMGRMLAALDGAAVDGAVQVAHAMTTHATGGEIDYFAAVDDITEAWGDTTGSAHMGRVAVSVRADRPVCYASAFEQAVTADAGSGFATPSITALSTYATAVNNLMGQSRKPLLHAYASVTPAETDGLGTRVVSIDELSEQAITAAFAVKDAA